MGSATDGILAYGYNLGGDDAGWEITQAGELGEWTPPWPNTNPSSDIRYDPGIDDLILDDELRDLIEDARQALLAGTGFTDTDTDAPGYVERLEQAQRRVGVELAPYSSMTYPMYVLSAHTITVHRGHFETVDFAALDAKRTSEEWDTKLAAALDILGVTPRQQSPAWLLLSLWSGYEC